MRAEIEARLRAIASPFRTAESTGQDIIDPRETRALLCEFVDDAQRILRSQLGSPDAQLLIVFTQPAKPGGSGSRPRKSR